MLKQEPSFNAPVPGMSLTHELGGRPWQTPPEMTTVEEVIDYYTERMATEVFKKELISVLEMDVPVSVISDTMLQASVMQGLHTIDVAVLVAPIIMEFIMLIGDSEGIKYQTGLEETEEPSKARINKAISDFRKRNKQMESASEDTVVEETTESEEPIKEEPTGLMARRS